jgi:FKBP-type peptidyl-prolyl cis-trans isomerase
MRIFYLLFLGLISLSCLKDEGSNNNQTEADIIQYLEAHNLDAQKSSSGLYYIIETQGEGVKPHSNSNVTVRYKGYYLNGTVFDQSSSEGISFNLSDVIPGWTEGIAYFNEGGEGVLLIPPHLGYGNNSYSGIPGGTVLIFDVKLLSVN